MWVAINPNATDMSDLIYYKGTSKDEAITVAVCMALWADVLELEVHDFPQEALDKVAAQVEAIQEMRENLRTGIARMARASAASSNVGDEAKEAR